MVISAKDLKKGTRVQLRNGYDADLADNLVTRQTRFCTVYGQYTEMGSVYTSDIVAARINGVWIDVIHSPATKKAMAARSAWGF
jgi:hypothetical protein